MYNTVNHIFFACGVLLLFCIFKNLYLCFKNITKEKKIFKETRRKADLKNVLDYYHAEVEILTMDLKARTKTLVFLLPLEIAKRDGFDRVQKPFGYVVEISIGDIPLELEEPIVCELSKQENILKSFKEQALSNSTKTEGILCGISTGTNVVAALQVARRPENAGKTIVTIAPSTGERYLSTLLAEEARTAITELSVEDPAS